MERKETEERRTTETTSHKARFDAYWAEMKRRQRRLALERLAGKTAEKKKMVQKTLK